MVREGRADRPKGEGDEGVFEHRGHATRSWSERITIEGAEGQNLQETSAEAGTGIQGDDGGVDQWGRGGGAEWPDSGSILRDPDRLDGEPRCGLRQGKGEGRKAASSLSLPLHCG